MTQPTVRELIERLEGLRAKATPGKWKAVPSCEFDHFGIYPDTGKREFPIAFMPEIIKADLVQANAALIVEAVNALPVLLAEIRLTKRETDGGAG